MAVSTSPHLLQTPFELFTTVKDEFFSLATTHRPDLTQFGPSISSKSRTGDAPVNWDQMFAPAAWRPFHRGAFGVHWIVACRRARNTGLYTVHLALGVENPVEAGQVRDGFKADVVAQMKVQRIDLPEWTVWRPSLGTRKKLLVGPRVAMAEGAERELFQQFVDADATVPIVTDLLERWAAARRA